MAGKESKRRMGDAEGVMSLFIKNTILRGVDTSPASLHTNSVTFYRGGSVVRLTPPQPTRSPDSLVGRAVR